MTFSFLYPMALYALLLLPLLLALPFVGSRIRARPMQFWAALVLRALVLLALILGLAGAQIVQAVNDTTVVFVVDHSDSVPQPEQKRAEEFIRASLASMKPSDRAAVVVFGENALVERLASDEPSLVPITSVPRTTRTNLASALRLALALFPEETHKRIVLLSDGLENAGHANDLIDLARARDVQIDVVSLHPPTGQAEAYVDSLDAPASMRKGQAFEIVATVRSTTANAATVRVFGDGRLIATRNVILQAGNNRISFSVNAEQPGFRRYSVELQAANDTLLQNNTSSAFTVIHGSPSVLVVENSAGDADNLLTALKSANIEAEKIVPGNLPGDLTALSNYDAVFLVNVPAKAIPDAAMAVLPTFVRDLGRGLVMIGGPDAYGAGGYLRTAIEKALPVDMDVRSWTQEPNLALVFVIDKSGSMGRCHCDDPSLLPGQYTRSESGLSKVDIAKDAVMQAGRVIGRADYVGVVAFDSNALWALRLQELANPDVIQQNIGGMRADGQTNIFAGLSEAEAALTKTPARLKHIVLLTDGWSSSFQYQALARQLQDEGITVSVIAAGNGSATYLQQLAQQGGGRYYAARNMTDVPQLFFKETVEATGQYIIEEPFYPIPSSTSPIMRGLDVTALPALHGYNGTTPKATARVALVSDQGDPILATWQYGLGRAVAWTSDAKGQWATDWVKWSGFNSFVAQLTNWVLPEPSDPGLQTTFVSEGEQTFLQVTSKDTAGRPRDFLDTRANLVAPDLTTQAVTLTQVAPGQYRAAMPSSQTGVYLTQITQQDASGTPIASSTAGLIIPYSPEYKLLDSNASVLPELARATGGHEAIDPTMAFAPFAKPAARAEPIWTTLLLLAALLFPLDVAARRLRLTRGDVQTFVAWARQSSAQRPAATAPRALGTLFAARDRARTSRVTQVKPPAQVAAKPPSQSKSSEVSAPPASSPEAMTERLKKAKDRARKSRSS
ncbi:MAG: VWA domain-containing protein [Chloroflexi bacterium]|nr:VWA domain-containing protein [Chloroflexota bacterium]